MREREKGCDDEMDPTLNAFPLRVSMFCLVYLTVAAFHRFWGVPTTENEQRSRKSGERASSVKRIGYFWSTQMVFPTTISPAHTKPSSASGHPLNIERQSVGTMLMIVTVFSMPSNPINRNDAYCAPGIWVVGTTAAVGVFCRILHPKNEVLKFLRDSPSQKRVSNELRMTLASSSSSRGSLANRNELRPVRGGHGGLRPDNIGLCSIWGSRTLAVLLRRTLMKWTGTSSFFGGARRQALAHQKKRRTKQWEKSRLSLGHNLDEARACSRETGLQLVCAYAPRPPRLRHIRQKRVFLCLIYEDLLCRKAEHGDIRLHAIYGVSLIGVDSDVSRSILEFAPTPIDKLRESQRGEPANDVINPRRPLVVVCGYLRSWHKLLPSLPQAPSNHLVEQAFRLTGICRNTGWLKSRSSHTSQSSLPPRSSTRILLQGGRQGSHQEELAGLVVLPCYLHTELLSRHLQVPGHNRIFRSRCSVMNSLSVASAPEGAGEAPKHGEPFSTIVSSMAALSGNGLNAMLPKYCTASRLTMGSVTRSPSAPEEKGVRSGNRSVASEDLVSSEMWRAHHVIRNKINCIVSINSCVRLVRNLPAPMERLERRISEQQAEEAQVDAQHFVR
ncbi:uncharacterized protein EV422DRAFT_508395 [Fimicolochytrium jonesii]|uniref:uncharacterized protein n=1 Tax=Fimicolochytrium jonesii TaxID=1396493 RepID=UPI0022FEF70C|nr:uncharacterized protein EV422DRAFT_508395 [Fimicolochytrium jonesii]KAI8818182.1 hypothetical protein EV422DRAFT_508395 [Fimicolochytrium jonesii]